MLVLKFYASFKEQNFQGTTIRPIVLRHTLFFFHASGSLNLTILEHIALAELCLLELTIKIETMICHILVTFMVVYFITTKPN